MHGNVQSFIVHKASGCKDVLIVTSPYESLGLSEEACVPFDLW